MLVCWFCCKHKFPERAEHIANATAHEQQQYFHKHFILSVLISFLSFRTFYPWLGFYIFFHITPFFSLLFLSFPLSFFFFLSFFLSSLLFLPFFLFPFWGSKKISGTIGAVVHYIFLPWPPEYSWYDVN